MSVIVYTFSLCFWSSRQVFGRNSCRDALGHIIILCSCEDFAPKSQLLRLCFSSQYLQRLVNSEVLLLGKRETGEFKHLGVLQKIGKVKRSVQLWSLCKKLQIGLNPIVEFAYLLFVLIHLFVSLRCFILKGVFFGKIREEFEKSTFEE